MSRARKRPPGSARRRSGTNRRVVLYLLLIVIGVLLGLMLALLPDSLPSASSEAPAAEQPAPDVPVAPASGGSSSVEAPEGVTEVYPSGEEPDLRVPSGAREEGLWWLPDPETFGPVTGTLYLILDDAGNSLTPLQEFLDIPAMFSVAVLPELPYSVEAAALSVAAGKEVMLHLPMEAVSGANPGPGVLTVGMADADVRLVIDEDLASVPGVSGVNNHMGSKATADRTLMETALDELKRRGLYFVDSRTTSETVTRWVAAEVGVPFAERDVFLDNDRTREGILSAIQGALERAHTQEAVVMIGHATVRTLADVLNEIYPVLAEHGYVFGRVSELVRIPAAADGSQ